MHPETPYRIAFLALVVAVMLLRSARPWRAFLLECGNRSMARRALASSWRMVAGLWLLEPALFPALQGPLPAAIRWSGVGFAAAGLVLLSWARHAQGAGGAERVREPVYASLLMMVGGLVLLSASSWPLMLTGAAMLWLVMVQRAPCGESTPFVDVYPRFLPRAWGLLVPVPQALWESATARAPTVRTRRGS